MVLNLRDLFEGSSEAVRFDYSVDLREYELFGTTPFKAPVHIKGGVFNKLSVVTLEVLIEFRFTVPCDRCLAEFSQDYIFPFEHILVKTRSDNYSEENDEYIFVEDYSLDLDELALSDVILTLPSKLLCNNGCKGLCHSCGENLNNGSCKCE